MSHYHEPDVLYLLHRGSYRRLAKPRTARMFLRAEVEAGRECAAALREYPALRIEPLDFHEACLLNLAALDAHLIADLCALSWRGVVWAAFLVALDPQPAYGPELRTMIDRVPQSRWLVELALARVEGEPPSDAREAELVELVDALRTNLELAVRPQVSLRTTPTGEEAELIMREREAVAAAYRRGGLDAAQRALVGTRLATYLLSYPEWIQKLR